MKTDIINSKSFLSSGYRIDPDIHLSDGVKVRREMNFLPYELSTVGENADKVFYGNIFSRIWVRKPEHGTPYLAASDTVLANIDTGKYLSKKQSSQLSYLMMQKDWILVTCSGTLGNVTYTNRTFENHIATHDLIRIVPNCTKVNKGTLYAFLSSKYGYHQITQSQFGGVVKHINEEQTKGIIVPVFPKELQGTINDLVMSAAELRAEAHDLLKSAHAIIDSLLEIPIETSRHRVSFNKIFNSHNKRFEACFSVSENRQIYDYIINNLKYDTLKNLSTKIFKPNIFKRSYVERNGVELLGGADMMDALPQASKMISKVQVNKMPELKLEEGWILITRAGTIGNTMYVDSHLASKVISEDVLRVVPKGRSGYIYAFLTSSKGSKLITLYTYGSVIQHIESSHIERVPIPLFETEIMDKIEGYVRGHISKIEMAKTNEILAVKMIEQEIEKWNK